MNNTNQVLQNFGVSHRRCWS